MAVRIVGVDLPQNKQGEIALTYIFGIGRSAAKTILEKGKEVAKLPVTDSDTALPVLTGEDIKVFLTQAKTLFGI